MLVHDGVRGLITEDIISDNLATFKEYGDATTAIPCVEVMFYSENGKDSDIVVDRSKMWRTQTPQTYTLKKLIWAHEQANKLNLFDTLATCDLMQKLGEKIHFSNGSECNLKITTMDDLKIFKALVALDRSTI